LTLLGAASTQPTATGAGENQRAVGPATSERAFQSAILPRTVRGRSGHATARQTAAQAERVVSASGLGWSQRGPRPTREDGEPLCPSVEGTDRADFEQRFNGRMVRAGKPGWRPMTAKAC